MMRVIEDSKMTLDGGAALLVGLGVSFAVSSLTMPGIGLIAGVVAGVGTLLLLRLRGRLQRRQGHFAVGDTVRSVPTAVAQFRPGEAGQVRSRSQDPYVDGKMLYVVEYPDGATVEIPELFLERIRE